MYWDVRLRVAFIISTRSCDNGIREAVFLARQFRSQRVEGEVHDAAKHLAAGIVTSANKVQMMVTRF